jgi:hypothetical protein
MRMQKHTVKVTSIGLLLIFCAVFTKEREAQAVTNALSSSTLLAQTSIYKGYETYYVIEGKRPAGFEKFENFTLDSPDGVKLEGRVTPPVGKVFRFSSVSLVNGKLTFRTQPVKGVSYSFEGNFLQAPPFPYDGKTPVLEGKLKKLTSGRATAEAQVKFIVEEGKGEG